MYHIFRNSPTVQRLVRASDLVHFGKDVENKDKEFSAGRKRKIDVLNDEEFDNVFVKVIHELNYNDLYPTFRTLVLEKFYVLLSLNEENEYFEEICKITVAFKDIVERADRIMANIDALNTSLIFDFLVQELKKFLFCTQQVILLFHLSSKTPSTEQYS